MKTTLVPYDVAAEHGGRPYLTFATEKGLFAWPWHGLRALRLSPDAGTLLFEFAEHSVEIEGRSLDDVFDLATATRLKALRVGETDSMGVTKIRLLGEAF